MTERVCVRFAPSPTGYLHLGSARTGLYNYIFARQRGGTFILRIEDTDPSRSTDAAIAQIISSMQEMGLEWDEGPGRPGPHGPYRQTERHEIYAQHVAALRQAGHLYPCFCTPDELEAERQAAQAQKRDWVYSGRCRGLDAGEAERRTAAGEPYTLRMRVPEGHTAFHDLLRGEVSFDNATIGDFIVQRSDGTVTYNLAVVVDDVTMDITHVIRGDDHISNTPKQVVIYQALGAAVPEFLHMPLLFGTDKKKLSKRHGATKIEELTAMGYLVEVVRNYLCFLSTEFDESMIAWSLQDLVERFEIYAAGMELAARALHLMGARNVLIKGGHMSEGVVTDILFDGSNFTRFTAPRVLSRNTHGTGCTLASAIAAFLAQGEPLPGAVLRAKLFITRAIKFAQPLGKGHGPVNHFLAARDQAEN